LIAKKRKEVKMFSFSFSFFFQGRKKAKHCVYSFIKNNSLFFSYLNFCSPFFTWAETAENSESS